MPQATNSHRERPATTKDLRLAVDELAATTHMGFIDVNKKFAQVYKKFAQVDRRFDEIDTKIDAMKDEIIREFKVVAENIHQDVAGANKDEISLIKDQLMPDHETRITILEKYSGLAVGPHH